MKWIDTTVGEYCPFVYGKSLPQRKRENGNVPVYGSNGVVDYHSLPHVKGCGVIIGRKGSVGALHLSKDEFWPIDTSFYIEKDTIDELYFVYYLLKSLGLEHMNSDSAVPGLNRDNAHALTIRIPKDEDDRKSLGAWIAKFDEKIGLNTQTNQTLEQIAQAIFKSWFVDFDPVKAKIEAFAAGGSEEDAELAAMHVISAKTLDELNRLKTSNPEAFNKLAQTAALFPAAMQDSELGEIPEGWSIKPINALCTKVQNGGTPKRSESLYWEEGDIPWLTSGEVRQSIIMSAENRITQLGLEKSSAKWVPELSTLVALYGATAGEVSLSSIPLTTNQAVCALIPKKEHQWFNFLQLNSRVAELAGKAVGSAQQNISKGLVENTKVLSTPESLLEAFNYQVDNLFKFRISNLRQNFELATLRDSLLPKLLSGEIDLTSEVVA